MPPRIAIIGSSGAGKTTLAGELSRRLGLTHVELDALYHGPNWAEPTAPEFRAKVETALAPLDGWIADGNYMGTLGRLLLDQVDTIVWLDLPLRTSLSRMWRRHRTRIRDGVELWNGNRETWWNAFRPWNGLFPFTIRTHIRRKWQWPPRLEGLPVVRLRTPDEISRWLETQTAAPE